MRVAILLVLPLLAGCVQVDLDEDERDDGGSSSRSQHCINDVCRTCVDGVCTGPLEDLRQEGAKRHEDVNVQESHDLTDPLDGSWSFWVDPNATGHVVLRVVDLATGQVSIVPTVCASWERRTASSQESGSTGNCSQGASISVSGQPLGDGTLLAWQALAPGRYVITATAPPQPNRLIVDIVVDNP